MKRPKSTSATVGEFSTVNLFEFAAASRADAFKLSRGVDQLDQTHSEHAASHTRSWIYFSDSLNTFDNC